MTSTTARTAVVVVTALVLQLVLAPWVTVLGVQADLLVVVALAAGLSGGPERGARVGFAAGLVWDLLVAGPMGLSAMVYAVAGYLVGSAQRSVVGPTWWAPLPAAAVGAGGAVLAYGALGVVLGHTEWLAVRTLEVAVVVAVVAALLILPAIRIMAWTEGEPLGLRLPSAPRRRSSFAPGRGRRRTTTGFRR